MIERYHPSLHPWRVLAMIAEYGVFGGKRGSMPTILPREDFVTSGHVIKPPVIDEIFGRIPVIEVCIRRACKEAVSYGELSVAEFDEIILALRTEMDARRMEQEASQMKAAGRFVSVRVLPLARRKEQNRRASLAWKLDRAFHDNGVYKAFENKE